MRMEKRLRTHSQSGIYGCGKGASGKTDQEELDAYGQCEPLEMDYESRKIALPEECMSLEPFPVRRLPY